MVAPLVLFGLGSALAYGMDRNNKAKAAEAEEAKQQALQRAMTYSGMLGQPKQPQILGGVRPGPTMDSWQGLPRPQQENGVLRNIIQAGYGDKAAQFIMDNRMKPKGEDLIEINGQLVNRQTRQVVGDYRTPKDPAPPPELVELWDNEAKGFRWVNPEAPKVRQMMQSGRLVSEAPETTTETPVDAYEREVGALEAGMTPVRDPSSPNGWRVVPQVGGEKHPAVIAKKEKQKLIAEEPQERQKLQSVTQFYDTAIAQIDKIINNPQTGDVTGGWEGTFEPSGLISPLNRTAFSDIEALNDMLQVQGLQMMRDASKTGGAVGNVTEAEWPKLSARFGNLRRDQKDSDYIESLTKIKEGLEAVKAATVSAYNETYGPVLGDEFEGFEIVGRR